MPPGISNGVYFPVLSGISLHESLDRGYQTNTTFSSTCQFTPSFWSNPSSVTLNSFQGLQALIFSEMLN
jgi:hypothetical protein